MSKHTWSILLVLVMVAGLVLAACAPTEEATEAPPPEEPTAVPAEPEPEEPAEKVTVRITTWAGVEESAELQKVIDAINAEVDHFEIVHEPAPDDYYTKVQTTLAGGTAADLIWLSQEWIAGMADQGALLDITECVGASTEPAADLDDYIADVLKTAQYEGSLYGLPWIAQPVMMYYNRSLFDEAGIDYPTLDWDWDTFKDAAEALTLDTDGDGSNDQWGFTLSGWPPPQMFVWQAGGDVISADLTSSPVDSPEAIAGFDFYASMIYDDVHAPPEAVIQEQGFGEMFKAGNIAMFMGGAADDLDRVEGLDVGVVAVPAGPAGRDTFAWTASTVVSAQTENPDVACEALIKLTDGIHHWKIVAPRQSVATAEGITAAEPRKADSAEAIAEAVPYMRSFNVIPRHQEWDSIFWGDFMDPLFHGEGTAAELAPEIRPLLEEVLPGGGVAVEPEEPAEVVTIRITTWAGVEESAELQEVIDEVNAEAVGYQIVHEPAPDDYYTKVQTALAGGTSADLIWLSQEWIAGMADQGALLDVTECVGASTAPAADLDDYIADVLKTAQYEGSLYGLPWIAQPVMMYYNRSLFDEAGLDYPTLDWDWNDFKLAAAELTKDTDGDGQNDQWGFTLTGWPPPQMFVWQAGGDVISADLTSSPVDSPEAIAGFDFYASMIYDDVHAPPEAVIQEQGFGEMFKAGNIAMFMGGAGDDLDRVEGLDVGVVAVPAGPAGRPTFAWTASTVVAGQTENPDLACEALIALTDGIHHWKIVAPRLSVATAEGIAAAEPRKADSAAAIAEAVPYMRSFNILPRHQEWDSVFWGDFMDPLFHGEGTAAELAPEVRVLLEELLPEGGSAVEPVEKQTIRITTWAGVEESAELQEVIDEVNARVPHFQIVHEPAPDDYYTKIQTALAGGTSADLLWLSQEWIAGMADQGALLDITDYLAADKSRPAANLDDYFADVLKTAMYEGQYYGLPWIAQPVVMYYNKALFDAEGMDYPDLDWDWDTFKAAAEALTKDNDGDGNNDQWGFTLTGWPPPQMFVWQAGGDVISADLTSSPVDSPEAIAGFDFYASMIYDDVHAPPEAVIQEQGFGEMFKAGNIAMFMGGAADDLDRVEGLDVGVVAVPAGPAGRPTFAWNASTVIAAETENPDLAYEALAMITEGIHHWKIVAPRKSLSTAEAIAASEPRKADSAEAIAAAVPFMRAFNIIPRHQEWDSIFWGDFMDPLFHGEGTAAELAPEIRPLLEELLPQ